MTIIKRPFRYSNVGVVYWLIGINVLIFAITWLISKNYYNILGWGESGRQLLRWWGFIISHMPMIPKAVIEGGWVWTFVTYMFRHGNFTHILFNMLGLFIFGIQVERQMGSKEFLLYYFTAGILAGIFSFVVYYFSGSYFVSLIGASGAIFGVELAFAVFFPEAIIYIWGIIPLRAPVMVLVFTVLELIFSITGSRDGVAHFTHLAGFAAGWLYFLIRLGINPWHRLTRRY